MKASYLNLFYLKRTEKKFYTKKTSHRFILPQVSWLRKRDQDILTVDRYTFVADGRFEAQYSVAAETWNLIINYVQDRDAGDYECQVSTEPKMSLIFNLRVVGKFNA